jgi:hypothetical protein
MKKEFSIPSDDKIISKKEEKEFVISIHLISITF